MRFSQRWRWKAPCMAVQCALIITIGWLVSIRPGSAEVEEDNPPHAALEALAPQLRGFLDVECPDAELEINGTTLIGKHQTQEFMVHNIGMDGRIADESHPVEGPNYQGFLLRLDVVEGPLENQAVLPQVLSEPYWQTYINAFPMEGGAVYLLISLSYGMRTEAHIIETIEQLVFEFVSKNK